VRSRFTIEQHKVNLLKLEECAQKAPASGEFVVKTKDIGEAFRQLVATWHAQAPNVNIEYAFPCGTRMKIVCLETVRERVARMERKAGQPEVRSKTRRKAP
jgi:hypothetical protein